MPDNAEVTAAGIARLAGVGRAAVSNWRRRYGDFPKPVGGTETSPTFALPVIEKWLRSQGKIAEVPLRERVWQQLVGHPAGATTALSHAGAVLLLVHDRPTSWLRLSAASDTRLAATLPDAFDRILTARLGDEHPVLRTTRPAPEAADLAPSIALLRGAAELAAELGARQAYEFLLGRHLEANPRQYTLTPPGPAELMAAIAGPARTVLDPASGTGALLRAVQAPTGSEATARYAQEADPDLAALTALRLALQPGAAARVRVRTGDSLRADAFPGLAVDAVLCHPPFNERNWGHDELAYDPRWEYGFPARTESELAWVQHALARLRDGGTAVILMPPAAASRRSGRRIRADLLRRGALRAVMALPAGAAPPYGIPLQLWVLRRPGTGSGLGTAGGPAASAGAPQPSPHLLLIDASSAAGPDPLPGAQGREKLPWQAVHTSTLSTWQAFDRQGTVEERPGFCRAVPVIDLLDDDVDLAPARHLPPPAASGADGLTTVRDGLTVALRRATDLTPAPKEPAQPVRWPATTVGELARSGALLLRPGGAGGPVRGSAPAVLTEHDVLAGSGPTGSLAEGPDEEPLLLGTGDVVVPVLGRGRVVRVVEEAAAGAALGRNLYLLRPDPAALDPWFLAGFLRGTANNRQASSYASTATRLDVRRLQLPRLPLDEQRRYGEQFRTLAAFEEALRRAGQLGEQLLQGLYDGLTDGVLAPE